MGVKKKIKSRYDPHATRFCIPFSIQCERCGEYIYKNKRFNAIKEVAVGEDYFGVKRYRFYIKCDGCKITMSFKTNPEKGEYESEIGCRKIEDNLQTENTPKVKSIQKMGVDHTQEIENLKQDVYSLLEIEKNRKY